MVQQRQVLLDCVAHALLRHELAQIPGHLAIEDKGVEIMRVASGRGQRGSDPGEVLFSRMPEGDLVGGGAIGHWPSAVVVDGLVCCLLGSER